MPPIPRGHDGLMSLRHLSDPEFGDPQLHLGVAAVNGVIYDRDDHGAVFRSPQNLPSWAARLALGLLPSGGYPLCVLR